MQRDRYSSIEEAIQANKPKGSQWTVSFGEHERYIGHIFSTSPQRFLLVTKRGNLVFYADEVIHLERMDDAEVALSDRCYWPSEPFL